MAHDNLILVNDIYTSVEQALIYNSVTRDAVYNSIVSTQYSHLTKAQRPAVVQSFSNPRPKQEVAEYLDWNGFQPLDIDIKHTKCAELAATILPKLLFKYNWVHSIALSTSGNGLHVYTYTKPISTFDESELSQSLAKEYYLNTFEYKMMVVWKALCLTYEVMQRLKVDEFVAKQVHPIFNTCSIRPNKTEPEVVDASTAKISQPLLVTSDAHAKLNANFAYEELHLDNVLALYTSADERYVLSKLRDQFNIIRRRTVVVDSLTGVSYAENTEFDDTFKDKIKLHPDDPQSLTPKHYDNTQRYRMAYTFAYLNDIKAYDEKYDRLLNQYLYMCSGNPKIHRERSQWAATFRSAVDRNIRGDCPCIWSAVKELKNVHGFNIEIDDSMWTQADENIRAANTDDKISQFILQGAMLHGSLNMKWSHEFKLANNEYIGTYTKELTNIISQGVNLLVAAPGLGKTEFVKAISKNSRVLLVEPYTSIITAKIETSDLGFDCFYGDKKLDLSKAINACMTFDKFTLVDPDEISMLYEYVVIDECHLTMMSSYRGTVPADVINIIGKLRTKVILMTGTNVAEHMFIPCQTHIKCWRPDDTRNKDMHFVICEHNEDKLTKIGKHISRCVQDGKKILFPTNKGNEYLERIVASATAFYGEKIHAKYYKKENTLADFVSDINVKGTLGDVDVLFCSNYLSVGVDINDTCGFDIIYDEVFTAQEIEQFNCRLRKLDLRSFFYFSKNKSDGTPKDLVQYEPLNLQMTTDEVLTFADVMALHIGQSHTEESLFDFFKYAFNAPYIIKDRLTGEVSVHDMCYKVHKFEDKWREWSIQLNVVSQSLMQMFNYNVNVLYDAVEAIDDQKLAVNAAKLAAQIHRQQKNEHITQLMSLLDNDNSFQFVLDIGYDSIIKSDKFEIVKRKNKLFLLSPNDTLFNTWRHVLRQMSRYYKRTSVLKILEELCAKDSVYQLASTQRLIDALRVISNARDENTAQSNLFILDYIINRLFKSDVDTAVYLTNDDLQLTIMHLASIYIKEQAPTAQSITFKNKIEQLSHRIFGALTWKPEKHTYMLVKLPMFDAPNALHKKQLLHVVQALFQGSTDIFNMELQSDSLSNKLATGVTKLLTNAHDDQITARISNSKHVRLPASDSMSSNYYNELVSDSRDIQLADYKFQIQHDDFVENIHEDVEAEGETLNSDDFGMLNDIDFNSIIDAVTNAQ